MVTFGWFLLNLIHVPFSAMSFVASAAVIAALGHIGLSRVWHAPKVEKTPTRRGWQKYVLIGLGCLLLVNFVIAMYYPITAWDSIALYDYRGHVFAQSGSMKDITGDSYYVSYPLLTSLMHASVYTLGGNNPQGLYSLIFAAFIIIIYGYMSRLTDSRYAAAAAVLLAGSGELFAHGTFAYTNLTYTSFLILSLVVIAAIDRKSEARDYLLAGLLLGLSVWTRSAEPFWLVVCSALLYAGWKYKYLRAAIGGIAVFGVFKFVWSHFQSQVYRNVGVVDQAGASILSLSTYVQIWHNLPALSHYIYMYVVEPYQGYWLLFLPVIGVSCLTRNRRLILLSVILIGVIGLTLAGIMLFSVYYTTWDGIGDSARRMLLFVIPFQIITGVYALYTVTEGKNENL
jgi:4-amino-4-deoxy-L-arabinose transferase-like glycosyltransferase